VVSGPIVKDDLLFRLAGSFSSFERLLQQRVLERNGGPYQDATVRGLLKWTPTEDLTADLAAQLFAHQ